MTRDETIEHLVDNCSCWGEDDRATLNQFSDEKLAQLANIPPQSFRDGDKEYNFVPEKGMWYVRNAKTKMDPMDAEDEGDEDMQEPPPKTKNMKMKMKTNRGGKSMAANFGSRLTNEEREDLAFARQEKNRIKQELVTHLTANVQNEEARAAMGQKLFGKSIDDLQELTALLPPARQQVDHTPNYYGAAGAMAMNRGGEDGTGTLDLPVMNFSRAG